MSRRLTILLLAVLTSCCCGCLVAGEEVRPRADTKAPKVASTNPVDGAEDVDRNVRPQVVFTEAMDRASVETEGGMKLFSGEVRIPSYAVLDPDDPRKVTFKLQMCPLPSGTRYRIYVGAQVSDEAGNRLGSDFVAEFTTGRKGTKCP